MHGIHNTFSIMHTKVGERCFNAVLVTTKGSSNELLDMVILLLAFLGILYVTRDKFFKKNLLANLLPTQLLYHFKHVQHNETLCKSEKLKGQITNGWFPIPLK
jgi:hypothetical protein